MSNSAHETSIPSETDSASARKTRGRFSLIDWVAVTSGTHTGWYLAAIVLLAALARIPFLGTIPNGFHFDEAISGYDAYCILHTGADHYGDFLPVLTRNFNQYTEAFYRYLVAGSVWIFGLTVFATRLPIAVVGVLTVPLIYVFAIELFANKRIALLIAFLLAVSPWHVHTTRIASSSMLLPFFVVVGLICVLRGRRAPKYLVWAGLAFGVAQYTYHGARGFVPLLVFGLLSVFWFDFVREKRYTLIGGSIYVTITAVLAYFWISPHGMQIWSETGMGSPDRWYFNFLHNLGPSFLFVISDSTTDFLKNGPFGLMPLQYFEVFTLIAGTVVLIRTWHREMWRHEYWLVTLWALLFSFPALFTMDGNGHLFRLSTGPLMYATVSGYLLWQLLTWLHKQRWYVWMYVVTFAMFFSVTATGYIYFALHPRYNQEQLQFGFAEALHAAEQSRPSSVYISSQIEAAYIHTLFRTVFEPREAQRIVRSLNLPNSPQYVRNVDSVAFGRYEIAPQDHIADALSQNIGSVAIVPPDSVTNVLFDQSSVVTRIDYSDGQPAFFVVR